MRERARRRGTPAKDPKLLFGVLCWDNCSVRGSSQWSCSDDTKLLFVQEGSCSDDTKLLFGQRRTQAVSVLLLLRIVVLFLLPLPALIFLSSYQLVCPQLNPSSSSGAVCDDLTWLYPYVPVLMTVHALVYPILSFRLNKDFASPSPLRRFPIALLIIFCCFLACFLFNVITFL